MASQGYFLGTLILISGIIGAAFFTNIGNDIYRWVVHKIRPPEPEPIEVNSNFRPENHSRELFRWVEKNDIPKRLSEGFSFYRDPDDDAKRFHRPNPDTRPTERAFFMWLPVENETNDGKH